LPSRELAEPWRPRHDRRDARAPRRSWPFLRRGDRAPRPMPCASPRAPRKPPELNREARRASTTSSTSAGASARRPARCSTETELLLGYIRASAAPRALLLRELLARSSSVTHAPLRGARADSSSSREAAEILRACRRSPFVRGMRARGAFVLRRRDRHAPGARRGFAWARPSSTTSPVPAWRSRPRDEIAPPPTSKSPASSKPCASSTSRAPRGARVAHRPREPIACTDRVRPLRRPTVPRQRATNEEQLRDEPLLGAEPRVARSTESTRISKSNARSGPCAKRSGASAKIARMPSSAVRSDTAPRGEPRLATRSDGRR